MKSNVDGRVHVMSVPNMQQTLKFSHGKLIKTLRMCPFSARFGEARDTLSTRTVKQSVARNEVFRMVLEWQSTNAMDAISEGSSE